jgi:signal transduction histidine kinase
LDLAKCNFITAETNCDCNIIEINKIIQLFFSYSEQLNYLTKIQNNLRSNNLNRVKFEFISCITHEIRNPLNVIINFSDIIKMQDTEKKYFDYCNTISNNAKNLLLAVDDIIDVAKMRLGTSSLHKSKINIEKTIDSIIKFNVLSIQEKNIDVKVCRKNNLPLLFVDGDKIKKSLNNIIVNAIKFNKIDGYIKIIFKYNEIKKHVYIIITDSGVGIEKEFMQKIFKDFTQGDSKLSRKFEGMGLGLFIARKLIRMHNGSIKIFSEVNKGTKVIVRLNIL